MIPRSLSPKIFELASWNVKIANKKNHLNLWPILSPPNHPLLTKPKTKANAANGHLTTNPVSIVEKRDTGRASADQRKTPSINPMPAQESLGVAH